MYYTRSFFYYIFFNIHKVKIKQYFFIILLIIVLISTSCSILSNYEIKIGKAICLEKSDLIYIKKITDDKIDKLTINTPYLKNTDIKGIKLYTDFDKTKKTRELLRTFFKERGFLVFIAKQYYNYNNNKNILAIINSKDHFDIVRIQKTENRQRNLTTDKIIKRLREWESKFRFEIIGAESYWIKARFITKPLDIRKFTEELILFCPELLNDGTGKIEDMIAKMHRDNSFFLLF